jgi:NAD(P)-dependent dehydrogenase (short-subunit alcohol dehydrogenase family)
MNGREQQSQSDFQRRMINALEAWTSVNLKSQKNKTVLVTGANSGTGYFTALAFAKAGADVVIAGRNPEKLDKAESDIQGQAIKGRVETSIVDLASLVSVRKFADSFRERHATLDVLINNAGIMMPPASVTEDGFESQFGVNFLGPFALTGLLYETLAGTPGSRVIKGDSLVRKSAIAMTGKSAAATTKANRRL